MSSTTGLALRSAVGAKLLLQGESGAKLAFPSARSVVLPLIPVVQVSTSGAEAPFPYLQSTPATQWQIVHGKGRAVSVTVFDAAGEKIEPQVVAISDNEIRLLHALPTAGRALII